MNASNSCSCGCGTMVAKRFKRGHNRRMVIGPDHHNWKGDDASYTAKHIWIRAHKTSTGICEECGEARYTEWANISGEHRRDPDDYKELCVPCHKVFDGNVGPREKVGV